MKFDYTIRTIKQRLDIYLEKDEEEFNILSKKFVLKRNNKYNFLHKGSIQVAAKLIHKLGLNNAILMALRDNWYNKFYKSILGIVETRLSQGPIWFNCFLDITINLRESYEGLILVLNTKLYRYDMKPIINSVTIIFRDQYKFHKSTYSRVIKPLNKK